MAECLGVECAIAVNSSASALHLILEGLGVGDGDEVITKPFSFIASSNCVLFVRAGPVFVDIVPETLCIDPIRVDAAVSPRTKAILAVDVFGQPADWAALERIADRHGLALIEDSAEVLGSTCAGRQCGSFGREGGLRLLPEPADHNRRGRDRGHKRAGTRAPLPQHGESGTGRRCRVAQPRSPRLQLPDERTLRGARSGADGSNR